MDDPSICLFHLDFSLSPNQEGQLPVKYLPECTIVHLKFRRYKAELTIFPVLPHQKSVSLIVINPEKGQQVTVCSSNLACHLFL